MFIAVYEMKVKLGKEKEFEREWAKLTDYIYEYSGSFGSRLHSTKDKQVYIAYAQWPSEEIYNSNNGEQPKEMNMCRNRMRATLESVKTPYQMNVLDDRLKATP